MPYLGFKQKQVDEDVERAI